MKLLKKAVSLTLSVALLSSCLLITPTKADKITNPTIEAYEEQLKENDRKQKEYEAELKRLKDERADAFAQKDIIDKAIEANTIQRITIEKLIDELEDQLKKLDDEEARIISEIENRKKIFLNRMAAMQEEGTVSYVELVLGAEDITDFLTRIDYVNSMLEYDKKVMEDLKEAKKELEITRETKKTSLATQKDALKKLEDEKAEFDKLVAEQTANINAINGDINYQQSLKDKADKLDAELNNNLQAAIDEAKRQDQLNNQQNPPSSNTPPVASGKFIWPLTTGYISSHFGYRTYPDKDFHGATDIAAPTGTPIYASASGTILRSEWHDSYGNYVLINHGLDENGNNITTLYAHMSVRMAVAGREVKQNEIIGQVGNTGYSFGSHLHFEYRINGQRVDPELYVPR